MSCTHSQCNHERVMSLYMKHNDLSSVYVDHLDIDYSDYMPHVGIFGGDDTQFAVCMQCGQIRNWKPISDAEIRKATRRVNDEGDDEDEVAEHHRQERSKEDPVVVHADPKFASTQQTLENALLTQCGAGWREDPSVRTFVEELTTTGQTVYIKLAAKRILETLR